MSNKPSVLVTGGGKGLGLAVIKRLLEGTAKSPAANVCTLTFDVSDDFEKLQTKYSDSLFYTQGDVTKFEDSKKIVDETLNRWKRLDAVVINAGLTELKPLKELDFDTIMKTLGVNTAASVNTIRAALPSLRESNGRVVFVNSSSSYLCHATWASYSASKAALNAIAKTLANEEDKVSAFTVGPGHVDTSMQGKIRNTDGNMEKLYEEGKLLPPEKPAAVLASLAVRGSRSAPKKDGEPLANGSFVAWDDPSLSDYHE
ncbi:hypothetical protein MPSI1_002856 [Malassezia psittaci]|uniref:Uncharacterized protein n=1 Tax=Malassezia psittaci TaxID=1821823 RepID=A0AAF0JF27_9BASI|nr:hypothetical protein MPSI1_002856 [Malassezia psittaci]